MINSNNWWIEGGDYLSDLPLEEQGLNTIFDNDTGSWKLITSFTKKFQQY